MDDAVHADADYTLKRSNIARCILRSRSPLKACSALTKVVAQRTRYNEIDS